MAVANDTHGEDMHHQMQGGDNTGSSGNGCLPHCPLTLIIHSPAIPLSHPFLHSFIWLQSLSVGAREGGHGNVNGEETECQAWS